jgi:hypothetical protein
MPPTSDSDSHRLAMLETRMAQRDAQHAQELADRDQRINMLMVEKQERDAAAIRAQASEMVRCAMPPGFAPAPASEPLLLRLAMSATAPTAEERQQVVQEFFDHLRDHGGKVEMYPMGMATQVNPAGASNDPLSEVSDLARAAITAFAEKNGLDILTAKAQWFARPVGGK